MTSQQFLVLALALGLIAIVAAIVLARRSRPGPSPRSELPPAATAPAPQAEVQPASDAPSPFLPAPDGNPDDLGKIKGVGPKLSARLAELGVFHYAQIANWTPAQLAIVDAELGQFSGRPERDQWQSQARLLAAGDLKAYERLHGKVGPTA